MATITLDIGGTKIASAIFLPDGSMMFNRKRLLKGRTGHEVGKLAADILAKLLTVARKSRIRIDGVGVCIPGIVYSQTNRVWAPNIPGWDNYPLYEELRCVTPPKQTSISTVTAPAICMAKCGKVLPKIATAPCSLPWKQA